jgi:hypothetical protein
MCRSQSGSGMSWHIIQLFIIPLQLTILEIFVILCNGLFKLLNSNQALQNEELLLPCAWEVYKMFFLFVYFVLKAKMRRLSLFWQADKRNTLDYSFFAILTFKPKNCFMVLLVNLALFLLTQLCCWVSGSIGILSWRNLTLGQGSPS